MQGNFSYHNPTKLYFGEGAIDRLAKAIAPYGKRVLLVYGGGSIKKNGIYDAVVALLKANGKTVVEADIPMMSLYGYCTDLRSMTGGRGDYMYEFARYEQAPSDVQEKEIAARANKLDHSEE